MYAVRLWSVRHARLMERLYEALERTLVALDPAFRRIGYERLERPVAAVERTVKGLLFGETIVNSCSYRLKLRSCWVLEVA